MKNKERNEKVEKGFPKDPDNITGKELKEHFDLNKDGNVTIEEYSDHINFHCKNPDVLEDELEQANYERGFKYKKGGVLSGKELKNYIKKSDYYRDTSFLDNISDKDTYVLKNVDIDKQIQKDGTLSDFIHHDTEKYQPNENEAEWINKEPIIIGSNQWEDGIVLDGYHRIKQAKTNKEKKISAFVKKSKYKKGGDVINNKDFFGWEDHKNLNQLMKGKKIKNVLFDGSSFAIILDGGMYVAFDTWRASYGNSSRLKKGAKYERGGKIGSYSVIIENKKDKKRGFGNTEIIDHISKKEADFIADKLNDMEPNSARSEYSLPFKKGGLTPEKAKQMLKDGKAQGHPLTDKQKRYFQAISRNESYKSGGYTKKGERFVKIAKNTKNKKELNGLFVYNPYYERWGWINDENLADGKLPYRVKISYSKNKPLGQGRLENINDLIIVDERSYAKGGIVYLVKESEIKPKYYNWEDYDDDRDEHWIDKDNNGYQVFTIGRLLSDNEIKKIKNILKRNNTFGYVVIAQSYNKSTKKYEDDNEHTFTITSETNKIKDKVIEEIKKEFPKDKLTEVFAKGGETNKEYTFNYRIYDESGDEIDAGTRKMMGKDRESAYNKAVTSIEEGLNEGEEVEVSKLNYEDKLKKRFKKGGKISDLIVGNKVGHLRPHTGRYEYSEITEINGNEVKLVHRHPTKRYWDNYFEMGKDQIEEFIDTPSKDFKDGRPLMKIKKVYARGGVIRKGDYVRDARGELGLVHKVKKGVAYVKYPSTNPNAFEPVFLHEIKETKDMHKGRKVYTDFYDKYSKGGSVFPISSKIRKPEDFHIQYLEKELLKTQKEIDKKVKNGDTNDLNDIRKRHIAIEKLIEKKKSS